MQWSRDGHRLLSASDDGTARVWTVASGTSSALRGHDDDVYKARFSSDERQVATASLDGSVRVWNLDQERGHVLTEGHEIESLTLDPDGHHALIKTPTAVARWDLVTGQREPRFAWGDEQHDLGVGTPSRDGELLMVPRADWSMEIRRRDAPPVKLAGHKATVSHAEFSPDDHYLYTSSLDGSLRRWDTTTGASTALVEGTAAVRGFALASDGRIAAQVGDEARMISPDGTSRVLGADGKWCISFAVFDHGGDRLILNRCDQSLAMLVGDRVIELANGYAVNRTATSRDGMLIAGAMGDRTVRVWDAASGAVLAVLRGHTDLVMDLAFSPDGRELASASYDKTIRIWELSSQRHRVLRGHDGAVDQVAWRDPHHLVTGSRDGTLRLWDVPAMELPTAAALATELSSATTARIELDRPTTLDGTAGSS